MLTSIIFGHVFYFFIISRYLDAHTLITGSDTFSNRKCFVVAESSIYSMINQPKKVKCERFICWESHLTIASKAKITWIYNDFRNRVAKSETINNMIKMNWHWILEDEALKIISSCPADGLYESNFQRNIEGLDNLLTCEYNVAVISLKIPTQEEYLRELPIFLKSNLMRDYDQNKQFRRGAAMHFGCALTITNSTDDNQSYFVCVYCSKEKSLSFEEKSCPKYTMKDQNRSQFHHLCHSPKYIDLYGCEPRKICNSSTKPAVWKKLLPGELEQIYVFRLKQETWLVINHTIYEVYDSSVNEKNNLYFTKPTSDSWYFNYTSLSDHCCIYDEGTLQMLSNLYKSFFSVSEKRTKREEKANKLAQYPTMEPDEEFYPMCCIFLFVLNLILLIGVLVLISFTYQHYKSKSSQ